MQWEKWPTGTWANLSTPDSDVVVTTTRKSSNRARSGSENTSLPFSTWQNPSSGPGTDAIYLPVGPMNHTICCVVTGSLYLAMGPVEAKERRLVQERTQPHAEDVGPFTKQGDLSKDQLNCIRQGQSMASQVVSMRTTLIWTTSHD
ncbi:hypothetical protein AaE_006440 [Aphanomyces astaci]|uniref:Uncharacterized protein n=1 Tax=Aphanomyces astaci TaxID=112090 RepID=A0A6A5AK32_APHAT|nr:hypothetical protein AaE_006440 [Aphanomyces astaci]